MQVLGALAAVLADPVAAALDDLQQQCLAADAAPPRQLADALTAALCAAAGQGAMAAWAPACRALGRSTGVLAGKQVSADRVELAATQLLVLLQALQSSSSSTLQHSGAEQLALEVWNEIMTVIADAERQLDADPTTWQMRRCSRLWPIHVALQSSSHMLLLRAFEADSLPG